MLRRRKTKHTPFKTTQKKIKMQSYTVYPWMYKNIKGVGDILLIAIIYKFGGGTKQGCILDSPKLGELSSIARPSVYRTLDRLKDKGYIKIKNTGEHRVIYLTKKIIDKI